MRPVAANLRLKQFRRRFGIAAPRLVVRSAYPRWWALSMGLLFVAIGFVAGWLFQVAGGGWGQLVDLRSKVDVQQAELNLLRGSVGTEMNAISIERAAQQQLLSRIHLLEAENAALKEDMLIFERLLPSAGGDAKIRIESFRVIPEAGGGYRYRMLLLHQPAKKGGVFQGRYEVAVTYKAPNAQSRQVLIPGGLAGTVEVSHVLRREGQIELPEGAVLASVEARLLQGDKLVAKKLVVND